VHVDPHGLTLAHAGGFDVTYQSPTEGLVSFGSDAPLVAAGKEVPLNTGMRYDNPWARAAFDAPSITIADTAGSLVIDFTTGSRTAASN
jgi:hypothetical protein